MALFKKRKREYLKNPIEKCVNCGRNTAYRFNDKVDTRTSYIEGCGQFCYVCYNNKESSYPIIKKRHWIDRLLSILQIR